MLKALTTYQRQAATLANTNKQQFCDEFDAVCRAAKGEAAAIEIERAEVLIKYIRILHGIARDYSIELRTNA